MRYCESMVAVAVHLAAHAEGSGPDEPTVEPFDQRPELDDGDGDSVRQSVFS